MDKFKNYDVGDYLKLAANVAGAAAAGFAQGGYAGLGVAVLVSLAALFQEKPGTYSVPKPVR